MEAMDVISKVDGPTDWCAGMVAVPKKSGDARICVDLKALNNNVMREVYPIPTVEETLAQVTGATVFSKLDANSGYWQIPLSESSKHLTTFVTPSGRYCFNKLPFGISSASEIFHKRMSRILAGCKGVLVHHDDVLVYGATQQEHDANLLAALRRQMSLSTQTNVSSAAHPLTSWGRSWTRMASAQTQPRHKLCWRWSCHSLCLTSGDSWVWLTSWASSLHAWRN